MASISYDYVVIMLHCMEIYLYSTSIEITYYKPSTGKICDIRRWENRIKHYIKGYFKWYGFKHIKTIFLAWMIYGGFFIW